MKLKDIEIIRLNNILSKIHDDKNKIEKKEKKLIPLTRKESLTFLAFFGFFSLVCYLFSVNIFHHLDFEITQYYLNNPNIIKTLLPIEYTDTFSYGSSFSTASLSCFLSYFFFSDKDCFKDSFKSISNIVFSILIMILICLFSGIFIGMCYSLIFLFYKFETISFASFNEIIFFFIFTIIAVFYVKHFFKDLFKNEKEQNDFIENEDKEKKKSLKKIEDEYTIIQDKIINSIHNIDQLSYFSFVVKNEKLTEVNKIQKKIEEKILKNEKYNSLLEYEKEILLNKINKNKIFIKNE